MKIDVPSPCLIPLDIVEVIFGGYTSNIENLEFLLYPLREFEWDNPKIIA